MVQKNKMKLSIVIPAHNEENRIGETLEDYGNFFNKKYKKDAEIIVVLNACTDDTLKVVKVFQKKYPLIKYLNYKQPGKGFALIKGFVAAKGELIGFTDADDATKASEFYKLITPINSTGGFDGAIASRWIKGSVVKPKQPLIRIIAGRGFNILIRFLFRMNIRDSQCGAKLFRKKAIKKVIQNLGVTYWAFDIDLLYQMGKENFKIIEVPVTWSDDEASKLKVVKATIEMFLAIIKLRVVNSPFRRLLRPFKPIIEILWRNIK